jgi:hypothetical protein
VNESTAYEFLVKNGIEPMDMHPSGVTNWEAFEHICTEKAKADGMQPIVTDELSVTPFGELARVVRWTAGV